MSANTEQRKLAAIMFTDMVGDSASAQRDETLPSLCGCGTDLAEVLERGIKEFVIEQIQHKV